MSRIVNAILALAVAAGSASAIPARAADFFVAKSSYAGVCSDRHFLAKIVHRFDYQVHHVPGLPDVSITDFQHIRERRYEPVREKHPIARQYCAATAVMSDGHARDVYYLIEGRMGIAGIGANVEFCVVGFDRWMVYNGRCRTLR